MILQILPIITLPLLKPLAGPEAQISHSLAQFHIITTVAPIRTQPNIQSHPGPHNTYSGNAAEAYTFDIWPRTQSNPLTPHQPHSRTPYTPQSNHHPLQAPLHTPTHSRATDPNTPNRSSLVFGSIGQHEIPTIPAASAPSNTSGAPPNLEHDETSQVGEAQEGENVIEVSTEPPRASSTGKENQPPSRGKARGRGSRSGTQNRRNGGGSDNEIAKLTPKEKEMAALKIPDHKMGVQLDATRQDPDDIGTKTLGLSEEDKLTVVRWITTVEQWTDWKIKQQTYWVKVRASSADDGESRLTPRSISSLQTRSYLPGNTCLRK